MREIKFRAWDASLKIMVNRTLFDRNWYTTEDKCIYGAMPSDINTLKTMQFTGLKDKNGVDIYEGDIVEQDINCLVDKGKCIKEVEFIHDQFTSCGYSLLQAVNSFNAEIIGNIYENPDLLEKTTDLS